MSKFAEVNGTTVVHIASPKNRLPPNPIFLNKLPGRKTLAASSTRSTLSSVELHKEDKNFRNKLLAKDRRSFLTGSAQADLQGCHLITNIRGSSADKLKAKKDIETFLSELGIMSSLVPFRLDSLSNGILLQSSLHCSLDLYAAIAILPTEDVLKSILKDLKKSNVAWDANIKNGGSRLYRPVFFPPYKAVPWQVLILHPDAICPEESPIAILANPALDRVVNPHWVNHYPVRFILCDSNQKPRIFFHGDPGDAGGNGLIPVLPTTRLGPETVCVMAAIINANSKLQHAKNLNYPSAIDPDILALTDLCEEIVADFFKRPLSSIVPNFEEDDLYDKECDGLGDSNPDEEWENGLTPSEFKILSKKARDPKLGRSERADAAMLMLFGPRPYKIPDSIPVDRKVSDS